MKINGNMKTSYIEDLEFGQTFYYVHEDYEPIYAMKVDNSNFDEYDQCNAVDLKTGELFGVDYNEPLIVIDGSFTFGKQTRKFFDTETREIITEDVLAATLEELKECDPDTYGDITLGQYINNCLTINNGTLEEI